MTRSTPEYHAYIVGEPDVPLTLRGGSVTLNSAAAPHVSGTINVSFPSGDGGGAVWPADGDWPSDGLWPSGGGVEAAEVLAALDPRSNARIRVEVDAEFSTGLVQSREFNLGLRDRTVRHRDAVVQLEVASDEALLLDYAPLTDDETPLTLQSSLRDVIDYVLDEAIPGAELEASPAVDADVTRYWEVVNRIHYPTCESTAGFAIGSTATGLTTGSTSPVVGSAYIVWSSVNASPSFLGIAGADKNVTPGRTYTFIASVRGQYARDMWLRVRWLNDSDNYLAESASTPVTAATAPGWTLIVFTATAPPSAATVQLNIAGDPNAGGEAFAVDALMFYEGDRQVPFFYGGTTDSSEYTYAYSGDAGESASVRTPVAEAPVDALIWRAGTSAFDFLHPLFQAHGYRLVCDEARQWTLRDTDYTAPGVLNIRYGVNMVDGTDTLSREGDTAWFDAAVTVYTWTDADGIEQRRVDSYALNTPHTRCVLFEKPDTPYPGPGFSQYAVERAQGRGRVVDAVKLADWAAHAEQSVSFTVPGADIQTGKTDTVVFDFDLDEISATARTTDTPANAISLLVGTISSLAGTIADL